MDVYFIRHGESEANVSHIHSGWSAVNLTENGRRQAVSAGRLLKSLHFDRVICSDLPRTVQTAALALPDYQPEYTAQIREINTGDCTSKSRQTCLQEYGPDYLSCLYARNYRNYHGENESDQYARVAAFMQTLEKDEHSQTVAVVTHDGALHAMFCYVLGLPVDKHRLCVQNASISHLSFQDGSWTIHQWGMTETF
ncbi:MAG: histidine phosphatase family protein [Clostridia bacterium]|nr:histidine phosphatase family protein [Clostridia bacterium]